MTSALFAPAATFPEGGTAAFAKVTLCAVPSELVHVTVAPEATLIAEGVNASPFISTAVVATGPVPPPPPPPPPPPVVPGPVLSEEPPQARMAAARGTKIIRERIGTPWGMPGQ